MQRGNDGAVRERELPFPKGGYSEIVAQLGAQLLQSSGTRQLFDSNQAPVPIPLRQLDPVDRRSLAVRLFRYSGRSKGDCEGANPKERANSPFHGRSPSSFAAP